MARLWDAEQTIEPQLALKLIQEQFPVLSAKRIRLFGNGWDNTAFIVDEELIFRFPRRQIALPLLDSEWCVLPKIARRLPAPIPVPEWKGIPGHGYPWPFIGYRMLSGSTACYANLSEKERDALAEPIARFLAALHAIPLSKLANCAIPGDPLGRIDGANMTAKIQKNIEELSLLGLLEDRKRLESLVEQSQNYRPRRETHLVHGDFYVRHLLVDEKHRLAGVIDWGDVHRGDPAIDLGIAHAFLPPSAEEKFQKAYGPIDEGTWTLARLRGILSSTYIILYGHHSGDPDLVREGLRSLRIMNGSKPL